MLEIILGKADIAVNLADKITTLDSSIWQAKELDLNLKATELSRKGTQAHVER